MTRRDGALVMTSAGVVALWISLSSTLYRYVRPSMQRWLVLSGLVLVAIGLWTLVDDVLAERRRAARHDRAEHEHDHDHDHDHDDGADHDHDHRPSRVGWLLLVPLVVAFVVDPGALGAYAVSRASNTRVAASSDFDLADHVASHSFGGQNVELDLLQLYQAAKDDADAALLASTPIRTEGFLVRGPDGEMLVSRLVVGCCAGDALPVTVAVAGVPIDGMEENTWVAIEGTFDPDATTARAATDQLALPVIAATGVESIGAPDMPYLYP